MTPVLIGLLAAVTRPTVPQRPTPRPDDLSSEAFDSILDAARAGAEWAWARLVSEIDPKLRGYLNRLGARDADDLAGETWLHVARGMQRFDGGYESFRSWVFTIGHHRIIDERRRHRRKPAEFQDDAELDRAADPAKSAETEAMNMAEADDIATLLSELTQEQREVVVLRVIAGFGITEIAEIVGKRPGAVQALQQRAFRRLEKILEKGARNPGRPSVTRLK